MTILRDNSKLPIEKQFELAEYKILRGKAIDATKGITGPKFFGMTEKSDEFNLYVTEDLRELDNHKDPMQLAIVAPDNEMFDMLAPKDYSKKFDLNNDKSLRRYLRQLVDSIP